MSGLKYQKEVEKAFLAAAKESSGSYWKLEDYIGGRGSELKYLNLKIPVVRKILKEGFTFDHMPINEQWRIWDFIWKNSPYFEVMLGATSFASKRPIEELHKKRKTLYGWLKRVDNWAHSDEMSSLYARLLEYEFDSVIATFETWNRSKNPWAKRQSMVGMLYYSSQRKKYPDPKLILRFIEKHIDDDHYYVQKGVGWALRECWNIAPEVTYSYLLENASRIPSGGWTAATEKLKPVDKARLKAKRAEKR